MAAQASYYKRWPRSVGVLTFDEQERVKSAVDKLVRDPNHESLNLHPVQSTKLKGLYSIRASQELRILMHRRGNTFLLLEAGHHDDVYARALRLSFIDNPHTGFFDVIETPEEATTPAVRPAVLSVEGGPRPLDHWTDADLAEAGLDAETIALVRECRTEGDLTWLPTAAFELVLDIIDKTPEQWRNPSIDEEAEAEARLRANLARYGVLSGFTRLLDPEEVERVLDAPIEDWMVFLHPDQRTVVTRRYVGPARVRGSAGTGKTVVGLHRAADLARRYADEGKVLFTTFVKSLPPVFEHLYDRIPGTHPGEVEFVNVDKLASTVLSEAGIDWRVDPQASEAAFASAWKKCPSAAALTKAKVTRTYAQEEIQVVIKGRGLKTVDEYFEVERIGRRMTMSRTMRAAMWELFERYQAELRVRKVVDFADRLAKAAELAAGQPPRFRSAIIDEAQDISLIGLKFIQAVVNGDSGMDRPDGLLIVGDGAQKIYPGGFNLLQAGVDVRGRTTVLKVNYRNTTEVIDAALAVAGKYEVNDLGDEFHRGDADATATRSGALPALIYSASEADEIATIANYIQETVDDVHVGYGDIAVAVATNPLADSTVAALRAAGVPVQTLDNYNGETSHTVKVGTHHRIKGLEFKQVFLPFLSANRFPVIPAGVKDPDERLEHEERSLSQLFVAMTRARDRLFVTCTGDPADAIIGAIHRFEEQR